MSLALKAARIANYAHRNQFRKFPGHDGRLPPYIVHPARVAATAMLYAAEAVRGLPTTPGELAAAAWLHDVVEDTGVDLFYLEQMVGPAVAGLVDQLTRKPGQGRQAYHAGIEDAPARVLKVADVKENLEDCLVRDASGYTTPEGFRRHFAAKSRECLEAVVGPIDDPYTAAYGGVPAGLWRSALSNLELVEKSF